MSASDDVPYFSRFVVKFIEILAAGLATAVSGYLIAHLAGALSSSTPAAVGTAIQVAPIASTPSVNPAPASTEASEQHAGAVQEANAPADSRPAPGTEPRSEPSHGDTAKAVVAPKSLETDKHLEVDKPLEVDKHLEADTNATETKHDPAENKHAQDAVLARIRAALAKSNAKRTNPPDTPQFAGNGLRPTGTTKLQRPPVDKRPNATSVTLASPNSPNPAPPPIQQQVQPTVQQHPATEPTPLTTVEIPSRPVATVQTAPAPAPAPTSQDDTGMFSGLDRLRHDPLATSDDAPRPPMPVGQ